MTDKLINISKIVEKVDSKYLLVMIAAKRSRQLSLLEQKDKILKEEPDKLKARTDLDNVGLLSEDEKIALASHKPIIVALEELMDDKITYSFKEEE
jgi:DNA-directed RNA polymerase omega subunit